MVLKLYGADISTTGPMVALVLHELNVPFEYIQLDLLRGEHKLPEHTRNQPFGRVPYIVSLVDSALPAALLTMSTNRTTTATRFTKAAPYAATSAGSTLNVGDARSIRSTTSMPSRA